MLGTFTIGKGRVLAAGLAALGIAWLVLQPARADELDDLRNEVDQLKQQVTFLQNQIPGAGAMASDSGAVSGGGTVAAQQEVRMQQLQDQMAQITGQIEQVGLKVDDLSQRLDRLQKDAEFRLTQLEQGSGTGASAGMSTIAPDGTIEPPQGNATGAESSSETVGTAATPPAGTQPGVLGTLTPEQAANLPQAPEGAAEAAAAAAAGAAPVAAQEASGAALPGDTPNEQYDYATGMLQRGAYPEAELALKAFVSQHPKDPLAGNAQYWLGETYYVRSDFKNAAVAFAEGYQKYPNSSKAPDNLLKLGMSLGQTGQKDNACTAFRQLAKQFPDASGAIKDRAARAKQRYGCPA